MPGDWRRKTKQENVDWRYIKRQITVDTIGGALFVHLPVVVFHELLRKFIICGNYQLQEWFSPLEVKDVVRGQ
jgi:hypothetical protein